ncbi:MAG: hypothetical protein A8273_513 [Methanohalophilus sp. 2-GBenrich]|nr:MAG: hypothetical protein A8273_513 [Methanohalophilus sp. 2-GBenrich]
MLIPAELSRYVITACFSRNAESNNGRCTYDYRLIMIIEMYACILVFCRIHPLYEESFPLSFLSVHGKSGHKGHEDYNEHYSKNGKECISLF